MYTLSSLLPDSNVNIGLKKWGQGSKLNRKVARKEKQKKSRTMIMIGKIIIIITAMSNKCLPILI